MTIVAIFFTFYVYFYIIFFLYFVNDEVGANYPVHLKYYNFYIVHFEEAFLSLLSNSSVLVQPAYMKQFYSRGSARIATARL